MNSFINKLGLPATTALRPDSASTDWIKQPGPVNKTQHKLINFFVPLTMVTSTALVLNLEDKNPMGRISRFHFWTNNSFAQKTKPITLCNGSLLSAAQKMTLAY